MLFYVYDYELPVQTQLLVLGRWLLWRTGELFTQGYVLFLERQDEASIGTQYHSKGLSGKAAFLGPHKFGNRNLLKPVAGVMSLQ